MSALLQVNDLQVSYGKVQALAGMHLTLEQGKIVTVIGPNGAGKSTLLNALIGLIPSQGAVQYNGHNAPEAIQDRVAAGMCLVPEKRELFASMTVQDNLLLGAYALVRSGKRNALDQIEQVYQRFERLRERKNQLAGTLSGGERQMLAIGRALMAQPKLLMLDEPSLGLAPKIVQEIFHIIVQLRQAGVSILLVEQNARAALQVADYGYVLETGSLVLEGRAQELMDNPKIAQTYLGKHQ